MKCGSKAIKRTMKKTVRWLRQREAEGDLLLQNNIHDYSRLQHMRTFKHGSVSFSCPEGTVTSADTCGKTATEIFKPAIYRRKHLTGVSPGVKI